MATISDKDVSNERISFMDSICGVFEYVYGNETRTQVTLAVAFGLLVLGISMMQKTVETGGFCSVGM